jgi:hypothetical protein
VEAQQERRVARPVEERRRAPRVEVLEEVLSQGAQIGRRIDVAEGARCVVADDP